MKSPNKKITAIAIDDEPNALDIITMYSEKMEFLDLKKTFHKPLQAIQWLQSNEIDLIFLDINMPKLSGLKFAELLSANVDVIFTTAYAEYALESYELNAVDYLLKPIKFERFLKSVMKVLDRKGHQNSLDTEGVVDKEYTHTESSNHFFVKSGTKHYRLNVEDILYVKKEGNYVFFHTHKTKILSRLNMTQLLELLPEKYFLKVHKSYIIALKHIDIYESYQVTIGGQRIPVGRDYRKNLQQMIL